MNDGSLVEEIDARIVKARTAYAGLGHLCRRKDVSLRFKGRVYSVSVRSEFYTAERRGNLMRKMFGIYKYSATYVFVDWLRSD